MGSPYFFRGAAYQALEDFDEAMMDYTKALSIDDKMTDAYYNRAKIILSRKDIDNLNIEKAVKRLRKALELDCKFLWKHCMRWLLHRKKVGKYHKALEYLERLFANPA